MNQQKKKLVKTILAIETSCDDTSISIIRSHQISSNKTYTNFADHKQYGGIIPELASRNHALHLNSLFKEALHEARLSYNDLDAIAYTAKPGLPGSLHTGKVFAKTLTAINDLPLIPIDHMIAHAYSFSINKQKIIKHPFLCLDASGGHTIIYLFYDFNKYLILNQTHDDAIGECLDKIGRSLNLDYPGGISLDKIYDSNKNNLRLINHYSPNKNFSFSGIKTYVNNMLNQMKMKKIKYDPVTIGSSVLKWCIDELVIKINYYLKHYYVNYVVIAGGVAANNLLRKSVNKINNKVILVEKKYCGDNAAMIANLADIISSYN